MATLTFRETQLLAAYRRCDARGRHMVEQLAAQQAEASSPPPDHKKVEEENSTSIKQPGRAVLCRVK